MSVIFIVNIRPSKQLSKDTHSKGPLMHLQTAMAQPRLRALEKRDYLMIIWEIFHKFCIEMFVVTSHLNRLNETVQMRGHNIWFQ